MWTVALIGNQYRPDCTLQTAMEEYRTFYKAPNALEDAPARGTEKAKKCARHYGVWCVTPMSTNLYSLAFKHAENEEAAVAALIETVENAEEEDEEEEEAADAALVEDVVDGAGGLASMAAEEKGGHEEDEQDESKLGFSSGASARASTQGTARKASQRSPARRHIDSSKRHCAAKADDESSIDSFGSGSGSDLE